MTRQKMIVIGVAGLLGLAILIPIFNSSFLAPIEKLETERKSARKKLEDAEERERKIMIASADLKRWQKQSLPGDLLTAQDEYMKWVNHLLHVSGFQMDDSLVVKPGTKPSLRGAYAPIRIEIEGKATLDAVSRFLYAYHRTDLLQRIVNLDIVSPQRQGNPTLEVNITSEGLVLPGTPERAFLFPQTLLTQSLDKDSTVVKPDVTEGFPAKAPFFIRLGAELARVDSIDDGSWTIERGFAASTVSAHDAGTEIELLPMREITARLRKGLDAKVDKLVVADIDGMPLLPGFTITLDDEKLRVIEMGEDRNIWTVERAIDGTTAADHKLNSRIQLAYTMSDYEEQVLASSPFVKPDPPRAFKPQMKASDQRIARGEKLEYKVSVEDFNSDAGELEFALAEGAPEGMQIDTATGALTWEPSEEMEAKSYEVTVQAFQGGEEPIAKSEIDVTISDPNTSPELTVPSDLELFQGGSVAFTVSAKDADEDSVKFTVDGTVPLGFEINSETGECSWTPDPNVPPGDYEIKIAATDSGSPPANTVQSVKVRIMEDVARYTVLVACILREDVSEAWLFDRASNRRFVLNKGDEFQVSSLQGVLESVARESIEIRVEEKIYRVDLGQDLRSMTLVASESQGYEDDRDQDAGASKPVSDASEKSEAATTAASGN